MEDRNKLGLAQSDLQISAMSKDKFRNIVNQSVNKYAIQCLNQLVTRSENSKCKSLAKKHLRAEEYLLDKRFSRSECELLFSLRTQMVPEIKKNFSSFYGENLLCELCSVQVCSQQHLLSCVKLTSEVDVPNDVEYSDIFATVDKQLRIVRIFKQLLRTREILKCGWDILKITGCSFQSDVNWKWLSHQAVSPCAPVLSVSLWKFLVSCWRTVCTLIHLSVMFTWGNIYLYLSQRLRYEEREG